MKIAKQKQHETDNKKFIKNETFTLLTTFTIKFTFWDSDL